MRIMREKHIRRPHFYHLRIFRGTCHDAEAAARERAIARLSHQEFKKQIAAGVPFAMGSDVGPFPHGTQARELVLMVKYGMTPLADSGRHPERRETPRLAGEDRRTQARLPADIVAVPGNPLEDISALEHVSS